MADYFCDVHVESAKTLDEMGNDMFVGGFLFSTQLRGVLYNWMDNQCGFRGGGGGGGGGGGASE